MTHPALVKALAKDGQVIAAEVTGAEMHLLHMAMGICGEVGEIFRHLDQHPFGDQHELIIECGDLEFYLEGFLQGLATLDTIYIDIYSVGPKCVMDIAHGLVEQSCEIIEQLKKSIVYHKALNLGSLSFSIGNIHGYLGDLYNRLGTTRHNVLQLNIEKLTKRYGDAYSDSAAIERVDVETK